MAYEGLLRVGLLVRGPGVPKGKVVTAPVSTIDLPATFADYAGVSLADARHSRSLKPVIEGNSGRDFAFSRMGPARLALRRRPVARHGAHGDAQAHLREQLRRGRALRP